MDEAHKNLREYNQVGFLQPDEYLIEEYEKDFEDLEKIQHFVKLHIWLSENDIEMLYKESFGRLKSLWDERVGKIKVLFESSISRSIRNQIFNKEVPLFFIHSFIPCYPSEFSSVVDWISGENDIFLKNFVVFYILNDLCNVCNENEREEKKKLSKSFQEVII